MAGPAEPKLAIVVSHPIQHFCPLYRALSSSIALQVFFASSAGAKPYVDPKFGREITWEGLTLDFPHRFLNDGHNLPIANELDAPELGAALSDFDPQVVMVYGYRQPLQRRALRWAEANSRKVVMVSDSELRTRRALWRRILKNMLVPRIYSRVDAFLSVGDANEEHYRFYGVPPTKIFRAPFPVDRSSFDAAYAERAARRARARDHLRIPDGMFVCTMVGKVVPSKRQGDLLDAVHLLRSEGLATMALIVGTGPHEEALKARAPAPADGVTWAGFVQPSKLPDLYAATDVYVHASESDAHALAISEAIYMGCPVIVSDRTGSHGPTDDVQQSRNGYVYPCGDVPALAEALRSVIGNADLRMQMSAASREIALKAQAAAYGGGLRAAISSMMPSIG